MSLGKFKKFIFISLFLFVNVPSIFAEDKIESVPLINLEELSPTFEEDKDILDKIEEENVNQNLLKEEDEKDIVKKKDEIYINITALDKITAKTSLIRLTIGKKEFFGSLEITGLKCQLSEHNDFLDTVAYLQVRDLEAKDNNQVFIFNGWTFTSSPTLQSMDHPIYDLWVTGCENI